jgi:hypothetical protein
MAAAGEKDGRSLGRNRWSLTNWDMTCVLSVEPQDGRTRSALPKCQGRSKSGPPALTVSIGGGGDFRRVVRRFAGLGRVAEGMGQPISAGLAPIRASRFLPRRR